MLYKIVTADSLFPINIFPSMEMAKEAIEKLEKEDKISGIFRPNSYKIIIAET